MPLTDKATQLFGLSIPTPKLPICNDVWSVYSEDLTTLSYCSSLKTSKLKDKISKPWLRRINVQHLSVTSQYQPKAWTDQEHLTCKKWNKKKKLQFHTRVRSFENNRRETKDMDSIRQKLIRMLKVLAGRRKGYSNSNNFYNFIFCCVVHLVLLSYVLLIMYFGIPTKQKSLKYVNFTLSTQNWPRYCYNL